MNARVLMTGATGFIGSHLARTLAARGDDVFAARRETSAVERLGDIACCIRWHDAAAAVELVEYSEPFDVVIHAATDYGRSDLSEGTVEWVNYTWPAKLIDAAAANQCALFLNIDTSLPPTLSPYAATKRAFTELARARAESGVIRVLNVVLESVFGPGDDSAKFPTMLLRALIRDEPSFALTPGGQSRDYIHVDDAVAAIVRLLDHALASDVRYLQAGVGRGESVTIKWFAEALRDAIGARTQLQFGALPYRSGELMEARADVSVLRAIGWNCARSLDSGIADMVRREREGL